MNEVEADHITGMVLETGLDRPGFREGARIEVPFDRIFDVLSVRADGSPGLNQQRARFGLGKRALIGLTEAAPEGSVVQRQLVGKVAHVDPDRGIGFDLEDGGTFWLPPDGRALEDARPGTYQLRSSGRTIEDPDYVCSWTIHQSSNGSTFPPGGFDP